MNYVRTLNIDEPLARIDLATNAVRYYHADALGSIIGLSNESGQEVIRYAYDAFGNVTITGEVSDNPFQYTGRENDGTGLHYNYFRDYQPMSGRYVESDPIGIVKGKNHLYNYVGNNPARFKDLKGLYFPDFDCPPCPPIDCKLLSDKISFDYSNQGGKYPTGATRECIYRCKDCKKGYLYLLQIDCDRAYEM